MPRILLIDDDAGLTAMLADFLGKEGFEVSVRGDGPSGLASLSNRSDWPDLVILDVMMPGIDGFGVLRELRSLGPFPPVLMLSARGDDDDRISGLDHGADDYLSKPFNPRELVARLRAILRRQRETDGQSASALVVGALHLDPARLTVQFNGVATGLTGAEFRVLEHLAKMVGQVVSRVELTEYALGRKLELYDRSIDTHVSNLRRKLGLGAQSGIDIRGVRGAGYQLIPPTPT